MSGPTLGVSARQAAVDVDRSVPPPRRSRPAAASLDRDAIVINGRFYAQPVTGVQRYGREIVKALDVILVEAGRQAVLAVPAKTRDLPRFGAIRPLPPSSVGGHLWEQAALPGAGRGPLLNLANTGPAIKARQIVCIHDTNVFTEPASYRPGFRLAYRALQPLLTRRAAAVTTVSRASAAEIAERFGLPLGRIAVLPNGHEHALAWNPDASRFRVANAFRRPFVLLLGSRARHKNTGLVLALAPALDALGLDLVVAGGGARIFAESAPATAAGNVHRLGTVSDDDLAALLANALCLAFPSRTEGFGLPVVEAMALRCPVVSSDRASMPEVCGTAALMASPDDPAAWLRHIEALARSAALGDDLRGRGLEQVRHFTWAASAQGYDDLLERLA